MTGAHLVRPTLTYCLEYEVVDFEDAVLHTFAVMADAGLEMAMLGLLNPFLEGRRQAPGYDGLPS